MAAPGAVIRLGGLKRQVSVQLPGPASPAECGLRSEVGRWAVVCALGGCVSGPSVDVELVSFGVLHGDGVVVIGVRVGQNLHHGGAKGDETISFSVDSLFARLNRDGLEEATADADVHMQPVLH